jgi:biotin synthase
MVDLPFQTIEDLANDLIFLRDFDIDMGGLGPYIDMTKLHCMSSEIPCGIKNTRFDLSLKI